MKYLRLQRMDEISFYKRVPGGPRTDRSTNRR